MKLADALTRIQTLEEEAVRLRRELQDAIGAEDRNRREYWQDVREIAQEAAEEPEDEQDDRLWELVDGSQWVIYTWRNYVVMQCSQNDDAWEEFGELDPTNWAAQVAFSAMLADCREELERVKEEKAEEEAE